MLLIMLIRLSLTKIYPTSRQLGTKDKIDERKHHLLHPLFTHQKAKRLSFAIPSVEFRRASGETVTSQLSPNSPIEDSSGESRQDKPRLQRSMGQSKKTFRLRKSRRTHIEIPHLKLEQEPQPVVPTSQTPPASAATSDGSVTLSVTEPVRTRRSYSVRPGDLERLPTMNLSPAPVNLLHPASDVSYDEDTSSTSGYRESYSIQLVTMEGREAHPPTLASPDLNEPSTSSTTTNMAFDGSSPDDSLNGNNPGGEKAALLSSRQRTASQHSLLMVFQPQDEDTLI